MNILLTGANGFVGRRVAASFNKRSDLNLTSALRKPIPDFSGQTVVIEEGLAANTDWSKALSGQHVVIHAAARAHVMNNTDRDPLDEYRRVNVDGTLNLARQAVKAGVRRFIFISSIKVNGEQSAQGRPFSADDNPAPTDPYGLSKKEAEEGLWRLAEVHGIEIVIIRPPLIYGLGVKGNFATMIKFVEQGIPLPLGRVHNKRSLVAVDNLVDLISSCIEHPAAVNQIFLASDGRDLSTTELLKALGQASGKSVRLFPVPARMLEAGAAVLGKRAVFQRLLGSLQVDISKNREILGWTPPISVEEGLRRCFVGCKDR